MAPVVEIADVLDPLVVQILMPLHCPVEQASATVQALLSLHGIPLLAVPKACYPWS